MPEAKSIEESWIHLGLGAISVSQPPFTGIEWYADYEQRSEPDGIEGRLVSQHSFSESWSSWEMHPHGSEVVVCITGQITLIQELSSGEQQEIVLGASQYAINPPGIWHTADVEEHATVLFITAGKGTEHRAR